MKQSDLNSDIPATSGSPFSEPCPATWAELTALEAKINSILPPQYQDRYDEVKPTSMGSAGLKYGPDGKVAWDQIWTHFCDLALAGGPPHRGTLLEPASPAEVSAAPEAYQAVVEELGRAIGLTTNLAITPRSAPGWLGVHCSGEETANWLVRAITAENVSTRHERHLLYLPAGPHFRLEKEIKNVVVALAKTCHYWTDHMPSSQRCQAAVMVYGTADATLAEPAFAEEVHAAPDEYRSVVDQLERGIQRTTGLSPLPSQYVGWIGVPCSDEKTAAWLMRAVIVENVLARREGNFVYLPANPTFMAQDKTRKVVDAFADAYRLLGVHRAMG